MNEQKTEALDLVLNSRSAYAISTIWQTGKVRRVIGAPQGPDPAEQRHVGEYGV